MNHPEEPTLQRLYDGDLPEAERLEAERHVARCARCEGVMRALDSLGANFVRWDADQGDDPDAFADAVFARLEATESTPETKPETKPEAPVAKVIPLARPSVERRSFPVRRVAFPAIAVAAAAIIALRFAPPVTGPEGGHGPHLVRNTPPPPTLPGVNPVEVGGGSSPGGAEVTRVDVQGAQSYAVLEIPGVSPGVTTAVVWIQDLADDAPPPSAPQ